MRAQPGITYAQIVDGRVHWLFTIDDLPEWADVKDDPAPEFGIDAVEAQPGVEPGWLYDGQTFSAPPPPTPPAPVIPQVVSRFQARMALHGAGLMTAVEAIMADPQTPLLAREAWANALEFRRDSPTIAAMAASLRLTDQQIDDLFVAAAQVSA